MPRTSGRDGLDGPYARAHGHALGCLQPRSQSRSRARRGPTGSPSTREKPKATQYRQHNKVNEIADTDDPPDGESVTASQGPNWLDPAHDAAGNTCLAAAGQAGNESWQVLEERLAAGVEPGDKNVVASAVRTQYLWDVRYIDAPAVRWRDDNGDGDFDDPGEHLYYCNDANMNVTAVVDGTPGSQTLGEVLERYAYDPYGRPTFLTAGWTPRDPNASACANDILYCGYRYDPETGFFHVRHRYYSTTLGRPASRDAEGYAEGSSLYEYARSMCLSRIDPIGLQSSSTSQPTSGKKDEPATKPEEKKPTDNDMINGLLEGLGKAFTPESSLCEQIGVFLDRLADKCKD